MSKLKFGKVTVVDLEATTEDPYNREIIEIGICFLDVKTLKISNKESFFIKPVTQKLTKYCTDLTGIQQSDLDEALNLDDVCSYLREQYNTNKSPWASFGAFDRNLLEAQCSKYSIKFPFTRSHIDIKTLFAIAHRLNKPCGLKGALEVLNLKFEGEHHSAADDAYNAAIVLASCL